MDPWKRAASRVLSLVFLVHSAYAAYSRLEIPEQLTLEAAQSLLRHNPALVMAELEIEVERADVEDAQKYSNPSFTFSSEGTVLAADRGALFHRLQPSLVFRQEILTAGKRPKKTQLEQADVEIASIGAHAVRRALQFELKQAYFKVVLAQADLALVHELLEQFDTVVRVNRVRFDHGEISGGELCRTEVARYRFLDEVVQAEVRLESAQDELLAVLGSSDFDHKFQAVDPFDPGFIPPPASELEAIARRERPELAAQHARQTRSGLALVWERARAVPNITALAGFQRELEAGGPIAGIEIPLFIFNRNQGAIRRAEAERRREDERIRLVEVAVLKEVRLALEQLNGNRRRLEALASEYLGKARQARDITETSYRLGEASLIELLDAERTYGEARRLYNQALFDFEISRARLELAVGKDL